MNPPITVIEASEEDKERVFELHCELFHDEIEERWGWDDQWQIENFDKEWNRDEFEVVKHEDQVIGYLQFSYENDKIYLHNIAVVPSLQNNGLGSYLLEWILKKAHELGTVVELSVHTKNEVALKLYKKFGFRIVESQPKAFLMRSKPETNQTVEATRPNSRFQF